MTLTVLLIIQSYFAVGAILFFVVKRKQAKTGKSGWSKFFTYMIVVNMIAYSMSQNQTLFRIIALFITLQGLFEIIRALYRNKHSKAFTTLTLALYLALASTFLLFTEMPVHLMVWTYLAIFLFDGFSQLCGQLFGRNKLAPTISPNKTVEGSLGGTLITIFSLYFLDNISGFDGWTSLIMASVICFAALIGDLLASYVKRKCGIKDFGNLLPGHGGVLDRFDSFVFSGAIVYLVLVVL